MLPDRARFESESHKQSSSFLIETDVPPQLDSAVECRRDAYNDMSLTELALAWALRKTVISRYDHWDGAKGSETEKVWEWQRNSYVYDRILAIGFDGIEVDDDKWDVLRYANDRGNYLRGVKLYSTIFAKDSLGFKKTPTFSIILEALVQKAKDFHFLQFRDAKPGESVSFMISDIENKYFDPYIFAGDDLDNPNELD